MCFAIGLPMMPTQEPVVPMIAELSRFPSDQKLNAWRDDAAQVFERVKADLDRGTMSAAGGKIRDLISACRFITEARRCAFKMRPENWTEEELLRIQKSVRPQLPDPKMLEQDAREKLSRVRNRAPEFYRTGKLPEPKALIEEVQHKRQTPRYTAPGKARSKP
jgi:hypothetical protein